MSRLPNCKAITQNGKPCKLKALPGEEFCVNHLRIPHSMKTTLYNLESRIFSLEEIIKQHESKKRNGYKIEFYLGVVSSIVASLLIALLAKLYKFRRIILLLIFFTLPALILVQYRWPLSLLGKIVILITSFLVAVGIGMSLKYLSARWPLKQTLVALIVVGVGTVFGFYWLDWLLPNFIALDCPGKIHSVTTLQGRIIDPQWRVYVLVWPHRGGGPWAFRASPPGKNGTWYATCAFGGGASEKFDVCALALPPNLAKSINIDARSPQPKWLYENAPHKTPTCVVMKQ